MSLSIENEEVEARVRKLAESTGLDPAGAIDLAVREKLERDAAARAERAERRLAAFNETLQRIGGPFPPIDQQTVDDELYDEHGAPR